MASDRRYAPPVHASIWRFRGDPDDLLPRYDAMLAELSAANMKFHLCLRGEDGIVLADTARRSRLFDEFFAGEGFRSLRERRGLPEPDVLEDFPVHVAFADGERRS
jgi:hypothetical protein